MKIITNNWEVKIGEPVEMPRSPIERFAETVLPHWVGAWFKSHSPLTWIERELRVPSLIVRVDGVIQEGEVFPFEVEERPAGVGLSLLIWEVMDLPKSFFSPFSLADLKVKFRMVGVESTKRAGTHDDNWWLEVIPAYKFRPERGLIWPRIDPDEREHFGLEEYSLSSISRKGDKSYGEYLGWWRKVFPGEDLPWGSGFVLKPPQGSKMRGILIHDPGKRPGSVTKTKIEDMRGKYPFMYLQELHEPMSPPFSMIRVFFIFEEGRYRLSWGLFFTRPNLRIHGASDSLIAPIIFV